jgi:hypothetical protein
MQIGDDSFVDWNSDHFRKGGQLKCSVKIGNISLYQINIEWQPQLWRIAIHTLIASLAGIYSCRHLNSQAQAPEALVALMPAVSACSACI